MGFDTAADVKAGIKAVAAIPAAATSAAQRVAGMAKALSTASQAAKSTLASQGKKDNGFNSAGKTIKTLGAAWKNEKWDKKVDETLGGKMAKDISENSPTTSSREDPWSSK